MSPEEIGTDISVTGGTLSNFAAVNGSSYTADFRSAAGGTTAALVHVAAGTFADTAGNNNLAGAPLNLVVDPAPAAKPPLLITEVNSKAAGGDLIELFNYGSAAVDLSGWKWDDDSASFADAANATFANGTSIAAGERLLVVGGTT